MLGDKRDRNILGSNDLFAEIELILGTKLLVSRPGCCKENGSSFSHHHNSLISQLYEHKCTIYYGHFESIDNVF